MNSFRELQSLYEDYRSAQSVEFPQQNYKTTDDNHTYHRGQLPGNTPGSSGASSIGVPVECNEEEENGSIEKKALLAYINKLIEKNDMVVNKEIHDILSFIRNYK
jgi:hypothetical protein